VKNINSRELRVRWNAVINTEFGYLMKGSPAKVHVGRRAVTIADDYEYDDEQDWDQD
jgi:hypothetical protein